MELTSSTFSDGEVIPPRCAFAMAHPETRVTFAGNANPGLEWTDVPDGTKSFALICHDPDAPSVGDDVNKEDREVPSDLPRSDFFHWVVVDLPGDLRSIAEGEFSEGVVPGGVNAPIGPHGSRQGLNDYVAWFAGDDDMAGDYYGYDGPAPPWNDSIPHRYVFTLYALDVERVGVDDPFTAAEVLEAIEGHILDQASITGEYTQNPRLMG
ncbi:MAG: YbhB/YbcL family Raf kinase inhibitor-like protein [Acidimicrobiia bacterium]|nr:YbhB/YbcL family Raf kinase inhibitor-like protein [Acidimicrobiia bacterium]